MIPYEKMSKKEKKKINDSKRVTWSFSPVSRIKKSKKVYNRKKKEAADEV